jgi:hypothetical protein
MRRGAVALVLIAALPACAAPRPAALAVDMRAVEECREFAESSAPPRPVHGTVGGRSRVYPAQDAETLRTLFDLCMQTKEALK